MTKLPVRFLSMLTVSALAIAASTARAETSMRESGDIDWSEVTGSIASTPAPFFQFAPVAPKDSPATATLQRLSIEAPSLRFDGEMGRREIPLYLRKDQTAAGARLKLRFLNSVAVMPEASRLKVRINDQPVAEIALDASSEAGSIDIPVAPGLLATGFNAITFEVQQRHRVDCTIEAANELWTQIDPGASGIMVNSASDAISTFEDIASMPVDEDGALAITIVLPQGADSSLIDQSIRAAQALAVRAGLIKPKIAFARDSASANGVHLYVGTTADLRSRGVEVNPLGDAAFNVSGRASGQVRVSIAGTTANDVNQNIFRLVVERPNKTETGTPAGLRARAAQRGYRIEPETEVSFADLGMASEEFNGRVYRASFNIVMPSDFYPADNGKATLYLDGEYVAGLSSTNEALVRVNGKVAGATRLTRTGGDTLTRRPVEVTLKSLNPGFNTLMLEIRTASDEDKDCNPLDLMAPPKRLSVGNTSAFSVPKIARIVHLPSLSVTASSAFPFTESKKPLTLFMPKPDLAVLGAAATVVVKTAIAAGRPFETRLSSRAPDANTENALIVGSIRDLPADTLDYFGLKKDMVPAPWQRNFGKGEAQKPDPAQDAKAKDAKTGKETAGKETAGTDAKPKQAPAPAAKPAAPLASSSIFGAPQPDDAAAAVTRASLAQPAETPPSIDEEEERKKEIRTRWGEKVDDRSALDKARQGLSAFLQRNIGYNADQLSFLQGDRSAITATRATKLVFAQQQAMAGGAGTWLLLTGPDSNTIQKETTGLVSPSYWSQMQGRMVAYDPSESELTSWPEGRHYHYDMRDWAPGNVTLVAAGWLSNHIQYYVLVILILCAFFGLFTRKLLNRIGAQP